MASTIHSIQPAEDKEKLGVASNFGSFLLDRQIRFSYIQPDQSVGRAKVAERCRARKRLDMN